MTRPATVGRKAVESLGLSAGAQQALQAVEDEIAAAYRDRLIDLTEAVRQQAAAMARIQETLNILVRVLAPGEAASLPTAFRVARPDESVDVATITAIEVADPIGAGYTLSQRDIATVLGIQESDVSILVRAFKLREVEGCAMVVREGKNARNPLVNFHRRAIERFQELLSAPPDDLDRDAKSALRRATQALGK